MEPMTENQQAQWERNVALAEKALDALDRMVFPEDEEIEDLIAARARIDNWLTDHADQWVTG